VFLKEGLEQLHALQLLDNKIRELELSSREIPAAIKELEDERDGKVSIIESTKEKLNKNVKEREKLEKEILLVKEKINKYKDQMSKATTNKEYQGFMAEIKYEEDNIASIEEKVIEKMLESDEIVSEIRESEDEFNKISGEYNTKITELKQTIEANKKKAAKVIKEKNKVRTRIPDQSLRMYDKFAKNKAGIAVSAVETEFCGVCNVKIRPQRVNELIASKDMLFCESCGRVLYKLPAVVKEDEQKN
jgi:predicted  nucleic acid-binding Zn-ribbon protein